MPGTSSFFSVVCSLNCFDFMPCRVLWSHVSVTFYLLYSMCECVNMYLGIYVSIQVDNSSIYVFCCFKILLRMLTLIIPSGALKRRNRIIVIVERYYFRWKVAERCFSFNGTSFWLVLLFIWHFVGGQIYCNRLPIAFLHTLWRLSGNFPMYFYIPYWAWTI